MSLPPTTHLSFPHDNVVQPHIYNNSSVRLATPQPEAHPDVPSNVLLAGNEAQLSMSNEPSEDVNPASKGPLHQEHVNAQDTDRCAASPAQKQASNSDENGERTFMLTERQIQAILLNYRNNLNLPAMQVQIDTPTAPLGDATILEPPVNAAPSHVPSAMDITNDDIAEPQASSSNIVDVPIAAPSDLKALSRVPEIGHEYNVGRRTLPYCELYRFFQNSPAKIQ
ncbi:hypothetical protein BDZ89DRAFT_1152251 [Hymenopellis radicata]|nr:hypothetical protein BDZ89DRAFT_1152251 [Hymenopellis radicata]